MFDLDAHLPRRARRPANRTAAGRGEVEEVDPIEFVSEVQALQCDLPAPVSGRPGQMGVIQRVPTDPVRCRVDRAAIHVAATIGI